MKRVFLIVLDSLGIGEAVDAHLYGDENSNTLLSIFKSGNLTVPNLSLLGLFNINSKYSYPNNKNPIGSFGRLREKSIGKDTITGHFEIAGIISKKALPVFPNGFPESLIESFSEKIGRGILCNKPYSGTEVIIDHGLEHMSTGKPIIYTSQDSVFQIAAHDSVISLEELYKYCQIARELLVGDYAVGRVIARPFTGQYPKLKRTTDRRDYSLPPPGETLLDKLVNKHLDTISIGKIYDIFSGQGISKTIETVSNYEGMSKSIDLLKNSDFNGLCFVNLVDFDMLFGHRNDVLGYAKALNEFDSMLGEFLLHMRDTDCLILTADHGCDPSTKSTDHSREDVPLLIYSKCLKSNVNIGTRESFADISATILDIFNIENSLAGESFLDLL